MEMKLDNNKSPAEKSIDRSILNMLDFYRETITALMEGNNSCDTLPLGTKKRLIESGIIRKFGTRYEITKLGARAG